MKFKDQIQIRRKVLFPLGAMIAATLLSIAQIIYWTVTDNPDETTFVRAAVMTVGLILFGYTAMIGFFYFYLGRIQRELVQTYRDQRVEIVHRRFAEAQLSEAKERAEEANRIKSEFLSNMSHELRTPLNAILGFSDLLKDEPLTDEQADYIATISASSRHLLNLINDILDLSKIESGKLDITMGTCLISDLLQRIESMMRPQIEAKGVIFETSLDPDLPETFTTDTRHLYQCLINLVGNAKKFTDQGSIRLSVGRVETDGQSRIRFDVTDTGIGIPADRQQVVFESFVQADSSTSRKYGGTGLGLPISTRLIGLMGGQLTLKSEPDIGSTFSITLPLAAPVEQPQPAS